MKNIYLMLAAVGGMLAFSACQESKDDHPTLNTFDEVQISNFLNKPQMANADFALTKENQDGYIHMTCSQPEGIDFAASMQYSVEVSFDEAFATPAADGAPASKMLATTFHDCSQINPLNSDLTEAVKELLLADEDKIPTPYQPLYFRLIAQIITADSEPVPGTVFQSNVVSIHGISLTFIPASVPDEPSGIFVRGGMNGWDANTDYEFLTTTDPNTYVLPEVTIAKGVEFKFADDRWGKWNYGGSGDITMNQPYKLDYNAANLKLSSDFTGTITLNKKGSNVTALFAPFEADDPGKSTGVFLRGGMNDWSADTNYEFLTTNVKGYWEIQRVSIPANTEFKVADADWGSINLGAKDDADGKNVPVWGKLFKLEGGGKNLKITDTFSGSVMIKQRDGSYYLLMQEVPE